MGEVILFNGVTKLDIEPDRILEAAKGKLDSAFILGFDKEGDYYFSSSKANGGELLWLIEIAKKRLLDD